MSDFTAVVIIFTSLMLLCMVIYTCWMHHLAHQGEHGLKRIERRREAYTNIPMFTVARMPLFSMGLSSATMLFFATALIDFDEGLTNNEVTIGMVAALAMGIVGLAAEVIADNIIDAQKEKLRQQQASAGPL